MNRRALFMLLLLGCFPLVSPNLNAESSNYMVLRYHKKRAETRQPPENLVWKIAQDGQRLRPTEELRTGMNSLAMLEAPHKAPSIRIDERTTVDIRQPTSDQWPLELVVLEGQLLNHFMDKRWVQVQTPSVRINAITTGFHVQVEPNGRTTLTMIEGTAILINTNNQHDLTLTNSQSGTAEIGQDPVLQSPHLSAVELAGIIQWALYYPAVVDVSDLGLSSEEARALDASLKAYRAGALIEAIEVYPEERELSSDADRVYRSAMLLSVGQVDKCLKLLDSVSAQPNRTVQVAEALRQLVDSVRFRPHSRSTQPQLATEWLAESYYQQSRAALPSEGGSSEWEKSYYAEFEKYRDKPLRRALKAAKTATTNSPQWGFAWARRAELEFSFGGIAEAERAVDEAIKYTPRNAQAFAVKGFLLAAQNNISAATNHFNYAIELDHSLANAWLGLGLCQIRKKQMTEALSSLRTAAACEPQRSLMHSYLGKAFQQTGDSKRACDELELAKFLDPNDPTAWLYAALAYDVQNRSVEAIENLAESIAKNDNRAIYRSRFLLDQDAAVRSANLADIYARAGMKELSLREAAKAVASDYADPTAHLHLAASYNELRDPTRFNLRYETEWFNEHLLGSLLAPVGVGSLSQNFSPNEYSRLFDRDGLHFNSSSEYLSRAEWRNLVSQSGTVPGLSYALDLDHQFRGGEFGGRDLSRIEWYSRVKMALGPQDTLLVLGKYMDFDAGDYSSRYDPTKERSPTFRWTERQDPIMAGGWHHEWSPEQHTLILGGHLEDHQKMTVEQSQGILRVPAYTTVKDMGLDYHNSFDAATFEAQHLMHYMCYGSQNDIIGLRLQGGGFNAQNSIKIVDPNISRTVGTNFFSATEADFSRVSLYGYHTWEIVEGLHLTGGISYDDITAPLNYRRPPVTLGEQEQTQWSPKSALVWTPARCFTARAMWARSLGGVSLDESFRLEPVQLAGFGQSFRSLVDEGLVGSVELPTYEIAGGALDFQLGKKTFLGITGERLQTGIFRETGFLDWIPARPGGPNTMALGTSELLDYVETRGAITVDRILATQWFAQMQYRFTHSELDDRFPGLLAKSGNPLNTHQWANMHEIRGALRFRHRTGRFAALEGGWLHQDGLQAPTVFDPMTPHSDWMFQMNLYAGKEFWRRRAELTVGILNITGADYRFSPLSPMAELPRDRIFFTRMRLNF